MHHRRTSGPGRWVAGALVAVTVASTVIGVGPAASPVGAQLAPGVPVSLLTEGIDPGTVVDDSEVSMDEIGMAVAGTTAPAFGLAATTEEGLNENYWVSDIGDEDEPPTAQGLRYPGSLNSHPGESALSGDGTTFVATYALQDTEELGECGPDFWDPEVGLKYWDPQLLIWQREDFGPTTEEPTTFGDPQLVTRQVPFDPDYCTGDLDGAGPQPPLMGVGGNGASTSPSVTRDGDEVAFVSAAHNLGVAPTDPNVEALYTWTAADGVEMVTPANMDGDVTEAMISGDGNRIVFASRATNLPVGKTIPAGGIQIFVATRSGGSWSFALASQSTSGAVATEAGVHSINYNVAIDRAGDRVAFVTSADNLEPGVADPSQGSGPKLVVRDLSDAETRIARQFGMTDVAHYLGTHVGQPKLSEDGESLAIYASTYFPNESRMAIDPSTPEGDQLLLFNTDEVFGATAAERRGARRGRRAYDVDANGGEQVAIAGEGDETLLAFSSWAAPLPRFHGTALNLFLVGGREIGPDVSRGWHGDPVDTASGAFRQDETDLAAALGAEPIELTRTYSSVGEQAGIFGPAWSSNIDTRLETDDPGAAIVTFVRPNGQRLLFERSSGSWAAVGDQRYTLTAGLDDWTVTDPTGATWLFDPAGRLIGWTLPGQPSVTVTWADGANVTIVSTSASGFELALEDWSYDVEWDPIAGDWVPVVVPEPDGTVDRATTSDGRQVDYTYVADEDGTLRLATRSRPHAVGQPLGSVGVRTYETPGGLLTRIVDQVDATRTRVIVENTYDSRYRVAEQVTATGDELTFAYDTKLDLMGNVVPAEGFTVVTNAASGDRTVYQHDASGAVVAVVDAAGNDQTRSWAGDQPASATSRSGVVTGYTYDAAGRVTTVTETVGATTRAVDAFTYLVPDSSPAARTDDRVATRTDEGGVTTTFTYAGSAQQPSTVSVPCDPDSTDPASPCPPSGLATTTYTYHPGALAGLVASETDADGVVTEYTYETDRTMATRTTYDGATPLVTRYETVRVGDLDWAETNPAAIEVRTTETPGGAVTVDVFDAEGRLIESRDPEYDGTTHLATTSTYGLDGELATTTDPAGGVTTYAVARVGDPGWAEAAEVAEVRTVTGPDGISEITKTDRSGDVVVEQRGDPAVPTELATTTHTYGPLGRRTSTTDPMGVTTTFEYDVEGRATAVVDEAGGTVETGYDDFGRPTVVTDPLEETTTTTYDAAGRVASVEDRETHATTYSYDDAGRLHTTTDPRNGVVEQTYTPAGRLAAVTDATGRTTHHRYDTAGRKIEVELPSGATTTTAYDEDGRVATVTSPEGRVTTYTYDDLGRPLTVADPRTGTTTTTYWPTGEVKTTTDATGGEVELTYDGGGRVLTVTDPLERTTTYAYDSRGNRTKRIDARSGEREWHWNLSDQLTAEIDPLDRTTSHTYDALGRLDVTTDGAGRTTDHGYDLAGRVTSLTYASGTPTTFGYDGEGRRTQMVDGTGTSVWHYNATGQMTGADLPGARDLAFAWDLAGRRTVIDYPDGTRYRNVYDTDGQLWQVEFDNAGTWTDVAVNTYDDDGLILTQNQGGSGSRAWTYHAVTGRLTSYADTRGAVTTTTNLTHDAAGRIESETTGGTSTVYGRDDAGQLTLVDRSVASDVAIAYDELGRRTSTTSGASTTTYQWDAASQLTREVVNGANHNYQYDASGRRTREAWNGGNRVNQWFWGARGIMTGQRHTDGANVTDTARATRGDGTLAALTTTVNGTTTDTTSIVWDPTMGVPQPVWTGDPGTANATRAVYGPDLIRFTCPAGTNCTGPVPHDVHGSALQTTVTSARVLDNSYTTWGDGGGTFTTGAEHGYRSELHTGATIHLRNRDYDPETGLFLSPDPLDGVDGTTTVSNPYHYADNDPVDNVDPLGLRPCDQATCDDGLTREERYIDCDYLENDLPSYSTGPSLASAIAGFRYDCAMRILAPGTVGPFQVGVRRSAPQSTVVHLDTIAVRDVYMPPDTWAYARHLAVYGQTGAPQQRALASISRPIRTWRGAAYGALAILASGRAEASIEAKVTSAYQLSTTYDGNGPVNMPVSPGLASFLDGRVAEIRWRMPATADCRQWNLLVVVIQFSWKWGYYRCL